MKTTCQIAFAVLASLLLPAAAAAAGSGEYFVYVGTYTRDQSKGIYAYRFQPSSGKVTPIGLVAETPNPSWLSVHPSQRYLYAANESELKPEPGKLSNVTSFAIDRKTGKLTLLNRVSTGGLGPCHLSLDKAGKWLMLANYRSGSVAVLRVQPDGRLGDATAFIQHQGSSVNPKRQEGPHAHCIIPSPDERFVLTTDLGLDQVLVYPFEAAKGTLSPNQPPFAKVAPGAGPRHFAFDPTGRFVYVNNELGNTVTVFSYQPAKATLAEIQTVPALPKGFSGSSSTAEIQVDRAGRFLYVSNRGHDSIAIFAIDAKKGTLTPVEHVLTQGRTPRNFSLDPTGAYLFAANQNTNNVVVFRVDAKTGHLSPSGQVLEGAAQPVSVLFVPAL
jgi:6-phosphogluconolactonase